MGYRTDACVELSAKGGITPFWGAANLPEKVSGDMGYCNDSIAISHDKGPPRADTNRQDFVHLGGLVGWESECGDAIRSLARVFPIRPCDCSDLFCMPFLKEIPVCSLGATPCKSLPKPSPRRLPFSLLKKSSEGI